MRFRNHPPVFPPSRRARSFSSTGRPSNQKTMRWPPLSSFLLAVLLFCIGISPPFAGCFPINGGRPPVVVHIHPCPQASSSIPRPYHTSLPWSSRRHVGESHQMFVHPPTKNGFLDHRSYSPETKVIPRHVAIVCDGNSRWARARNLPSAVGHAAGADRLVEVLEALRGAGVDYCTLYGFSTENWKRPKSEIRDILVVMEQTARRFYHRAVQENVSVRILGDLTDDRIPKSLKDILDKLERDTHNVVDDTGRRLTLCLAINYGGRRDILNATKRLAARIIDGTQNDDITEEDFASLLSTSGIPDPDLVIRTSGESRLSNFLLWNVAYAELYFSSVLWPDFDEACVESALDWYAQRRRRFGAREKLEAL